MAELGEHPVGQPAQQRRAFLIGQSARVFLHRGLHARPIGNGGVDIAERGLERRDQFAPLACIDPLGFEIDHRFAALAHGIAFGQREQSAGRIAPHRNDRVHQPVDRQPLRRNRPRNRIDKERHVIVDHRDAQVACGLPADALDRDGGGRTGARCRRCQREAGRLGNACRLEIRRLIGEQRRGEANGQLLGEIRVHAGNGGFAGHDRSCFPAQRLVACAVIVIRPILRVRNIMSQ